jgi:predicted amidohydrolase
MALFDREDRARHSARRSMVFLEAAEAAASEAGVVFLDLDVEAKQKWLQENMASVIRRCVLIGGEEYNNLRYYNAYVVENQGSAVLYFERRR